MTPPLRIVLVLHEPPLPFGGAVARWYHVLLTGLVDRGHSVAVLATCNRPEDFQATANAFPAPRYDVRLFPPGRSRGLTGKLTSAIWPYSYQFGEGLRLALKAEIAKGYDVLHLETTWAGHLVPGSTPRVVLGVQYLYEIDWAHQGGGTLAARALRVASLSAERRLLRKFRHVATLTPRLTDRVRQLAPAADVRTVPMALDLSLYPFQEPDASGPPTVGLIGSYNWAPTFGAGERLVTRLWPEVRRRVPEARLLIVGRKARAALGKYASVPGLTLEEDVPDALPYFRQLDVMAYAPPTGSGIKVKVMEAMALGTPVVSNADGLEGLSVTDGVEASAGDDDESLIRHIIRLLNDPDARRSQALAAKKMLEDVYSASAAVDRLESAYSHIQRGHTEIA